MLRRSVHYTITSNLEAGGYISCCHIQFLLREDINIVLAYTAGALELLTPFRVSGWQSLCNLHVLSCMFHTPLQKGLLKPCGLLLGSCLVRISAGTVAILTGFQVPLVHPGKF
jgi:hypothetical protein